MNNSTFSMRIIAICALMLFCVVVYRISILHSSDNFLHNETVQVKEDSVLFQELIDENLISPLCDSENKTQLLTYVPSDSLEQYLILREDASDVYKVVIDRRIDLIKKLHYTTVGSAIRKSISEWNASHLFAGIRDNRLGVAPDSTLWTAHHTRYPALQSRISSHMPEFCAYVTGGNMRAGFNNWTRFFQDEGDENLCVSTVVELDAPQTLVVQVVGEVCDINPKPQKVIPRYADNRSFKQLNAGTESQKVLGNEIIFTLPEGRHSINLTLAPVPFAIDRIPGQNIVWNSEHEWPKAVSWTNYAHNMWHSPMPSSIQTADAVLLNDKDGCATTTSWDLGLTSLTGITHQDTNTLEWIFASTTQPNDITLTIDATMQRIAVESLEAGIKSLDDPKIAANIDSTKRRAGLVMMDADTGEILAAATYPNIKSDVNIWDINAFSRYYHTQSLRTFKAFQGIDANNAPGSTFKPVVAMAALKAVNDEIEGFENIESYLQGYTPEEFDEKAGMSFSTVAYNPVEHIEHVQFVTNKATNTWQSRPNIIGVTGIIRNSPLQPMSYFRHKDKTFGLTQAVRGSVNTWFVRLGELLDSKGEAAAYDLNPTQKPWPDLYLGQFAKTLGFNGDAINLLANVDPALSIQRTRPSRYGEGDALFAVTGSLRILEGKHNALLELERAQNAIGQAMTATPLQMARVAALAATESLPNPSIIKNVNGVDIAPNPARAIEFSTSFFGLGPQKGESLKLLTDGMHAVVNQYGGTAFKAFRHYPIADRVYGKTGTANVENASGRTAYNSAWFIGWQEPAQENERRIAFACYVTHSPKKKGYGGGDVAAPIVANILGELYDIEHAQNEGEEQAQ